MDRGRNGRTGGTRRAAAPASSALDDGAGIRNARARQRAFCIAAGPNETNLAELKELLRTAGVAVAGELTQRRAEPDPDRYFGRGKLAELKQAIAASGANLVACDDELKPRQERNLEQALDVPVIDRTAIILDIFADHAHTAEGKLQVELAQLEYNLARMRGLWTHLERLGAGRVDGGIGTRGPGETQIETDRRLARDRIAALKRRLDHTQGVRDTMRRERERAGLPTVALVGYTDAGKSTLLNALTGAQVGVRERLFHTLDPTTRSFEIGGRDYLLTDTVGFIRKLPHQLVEAFSATLEEALGADLLVHVADASVPEAELHEMLAAVDDVLAETGAGERPRLLALNKVDVLEDDRSGAGQPAPSRTPDRSGAGQPAPSRTPDCSGAGQPAPSRTPDRSGAGQPAPSRTAERRRELSFRFPRAVQVSGATGEGLDELREAIEARFLASLRPMELLLPYEEGGSLSELHDVAGELERTDTAEGVRVRARVPAAAAPRFERFSTNGGSGG